MLHCIYMSYMTCLDNVYIYTINVEHIEESRA